MEANTDAALRGFLARVLGWSPSRADAVEHAVRSIELAVDRSAALVLLGDTDLVPIAHVLHRRTLDPDARSWCAIVGDPTSTGLSAPRRTTRAAWPGSRRQAAAPCACTTLGDRAIFRR